MREAKLEITMMPVAELVRYKNNAKIHTAAQIEHIANSIKAFGFNDPVGIWHNADGLPEIVTGHGAVEAAELIGLAEVPCTFLDHMTDEERREYCHIHNGTQLETGFDVGALIADMSELDIDWSMFGFDGFAQLEESLDDVMESPIPEDAPTRCKEGDVWELGGHRLVCGSATDANDMQKLVRGGGGSIARD